MRGHGDCCLVLPGNCVATWSLRDRHDGRDSVPACRSAAARVPMVLLRLGRRGRRGASSLVSAVLAAAGVAVWVYGTTGHVFRATSVRCRRATCGCRAAGGVRFSPTPPPKRRAAPRPSVGDRTRSSGCSRDVTPFHGAVPTVLTRCVRPARCLKCRSGTARRSNLLTRQGRMSPARLAGSGNCWPSGTRAVRSGGRRFAGRIRRRGGDGIRRPICRCSQRDPRRMVYAVGGPGRRAPAENRDLGPPPARRQRR